MLDKITALATINEIVRNRVRIKDLVTERYWDNCFASRMERWQKAFGDTLHVTLSPPAASPQQKLRAWQIVFGSPLGVAEAQIYPQDFHHKKSGYNYNPINCRINKQFPTDLLTLENVTSGTAPNPRGKGQPIKLTKALTAFLAQQHCPYRHTPMGEEIAAGLVAAATVAVNSTTGLKITLSANPIDLALTTEVCTFTSCHRLDGPQAAGPFCYARDPQMLVAYAHDGEPCPEGGKKLPKKTWRQLIICPTEQPTFAAFVRHYPHTMPDAPHSVIRLAVARALSGNPELTEEGFHYQLAGQPGCPTVGVRRDRGPYQDGFSAFLTVEPPVGTRRPFPREIQIGLGHTHCPKCDKERTAALLNETDNPGRLLCDECTTAHLPRVACDHCGTMHPEADAHHQWLHTTNFEQTVTRRICRPCQRRHAFTRCPECGLHQIDIGHRYSGWNGRSFTRLMTSCMECHTARATAEKWTPVTFAPLPETSKTYVPTGWYETALHRRKSPPVEDGVTPATFPETEKFTSRYHQFWFHFTTPGRKCNTEAMVPNQLCRKFDRQAAIAAPYKDQDYYHYERVALVSAIQGNPGVNFLPVDPETPETLAIKAELLRKKLGETLAFPEGYDPTQGGKYTLLKLGQTIPEGSRFLTHEALATLKRIYQEAGRVTPGDDQFLWKIAMSTVGKAFDPTTDNMRCFAYYRVAAEVAAKIPQPAAPPPPAPLPPGENPAARAFRIPEWVRQVQELG